MASEDPAADCDESDPVNCDSFQQLIVDAELTFTIIFTIEMVFKILGMGWKRYIGDNWNKIDFTVVVISYISFLPGVGNLQALRTLRLLRTLRSVAKVKSMKKVVGVLLTAIPLLSEVMLLCAFVMLILAVLGLHLFMGTFRNQCMSEGGELDGTLCGGEVECGGDFPMCAKQGTIESNPNFGITNYDHIGYALLTVFQLTTAEGWTEIMYWTFDTYGYWSVVYYLITIWIGALIAISIAFAALENVWGDLEDDEDDGDGIPEEPICKRLSDAMFNSVFCRPFKCIDVASTSLGAKAKRIADAQWFDTVVFNAILINTFCLAMFRADISHGEEQAYSVVNIILTLFFLCEMIIRICGYNLSGYLSDAMNAFDGTIVILSLVELASDGGGIISVFRALRLLRVLRMMKRYRALNNLLSGMVRSIQAVSALTMVMLLFLFIFALVGKEFFGKQWDDDSERYMYDNIAWAFYSVFVTFTGENWNAQMYDGMRQKGPGWAIYFLLIMVCGNYIILNLFMAIMLDNLQGATEDAAEEDSPEIVAEKARVVALQEAAITRDGQTDQELIDAAPDAASKYRIVQLRKRFDHFDENKNGYIDEAEVSQLLKWCKIKLSNMEFNIIFADDKFTFPEFLTLMNQYEINLEDLEDIPLGAAVDSNSLLFSPRDIGGFGQVDGEAIPFTDAEIKILEDADLDPKVLVTPEMGTTNRITLDPSRKSLWIFSTTNLFRKAMVKVAESDSFNKFILFCIVASTILVALDEPGRSQEFKDNLDVLDKIFTYIFIIELLVKAVAMGFFYDTGPDSYWFSSNFNRLDFTIIVISCITLGLPADSEISALKALRAFRALRPLRAVGQFDSLKVVLNSMMQSFVPMFYGLGFFIFFLFIFAVFGTHFFAGKMHYCRTLGEEPIELGNITAWSECPSLCDETPSVCTSAMCTDCYIIDDDGNAMGQERIWENYVQNFDNVAHSMVVLFEMTTLEAWPTIALQGVDATGVDTWPEPNFNHWYMWYFILFTMMVTFFVAQIFAGVVCDKFDRLTQFYDNTLFLTEAQRTWWFDAKEVVMARPTLITRDPMIKELEKIAMHPLLDMFIITCICLNMVVLCMYTEDMTQGYEDALETVNLVFVIIFILELIIKVLGMGVVAYLADAWNKFDAVIVLISIITLAVDVGSMASVLRVFRLARIIKLLPRMESLMSVVMTMVYAIPAIGNVMMLMLLFFIIFAALGVGLFGKTVRGDFLGQYANFETFPIAMLTLFRISTGEDWNGIMHDCSLEEGDYNSAGAQCSKEIGNCGANYTSQAYFVIFNLLSAFVLLNMVVGAVLMAFDASRQHFKEGVTQHMVSTFKMEWYRLDPDANARIPVTSFPQLYKVISVVFGLPQTDEMMNDVLRKCEVYDGEELKFSDVLFTIAFQAFGSPLMSSNLAGLLEKLKTKQEKKLDGSLAKLSFKQDKTALNVRAQPIERLTEQQLMSMDGDKLIEELRKRGAIRSQRPEGLSLSMRGVAKP